MVEVAASGDGQGPLLRGLLRGQRLLTAGGSTDPVGVVAQVAGINSQAARALHLGLAARGLADPVPACDDALRAHTVVRANLTRGTLRTVSAADYRAWRPALQPVLERVTRGFLGRALDDMPVQAVLEEARGLLGQEPLNRSGLGRALAARFPDHAGGDGAGKDLAFAARMLLPVVQEPAAGCWQPERRPRYLLAEQVLGPLDESPEAASAGLASLARRYLAAFGPATAADLRTWSGLTRTDPARVRELVPEAEELDLHGTTYLALPEPQADLSESDGRGDGDDGGGLPAVLLLPPFDDVLFAHADRERVATKDQLRRLVPPAVEMPGIVLVHGRAAGRWRHRAGRRKGEEGVLEVHLFPESAPPADELAEAAESLAALLGAGGPAPRVVVDPWPAR